MMSSSMCCRMSRRNMSIFSSFDGKRLEPINCSINRLFPGSCKESDRSCGYDIHSLDRIPCKFTRNWNSIGCATRDIDKRVGDSMCIGMVNSSKCTSRDKIIDTIECMREYAHNRLPSIFEESIFTDF